MSGKRIIVLGGGFAGVECARTLQRLLPSADHEIVVFNTENHMVFHPLLAELAAAVVQPKDVAAPLRLLLKGVKCRREEVTGIDLEGNEIEFEAPNGERQRIGFDQLVIAGGSTVNLGIVPGMADFAFPLKTMGDAIKLQGHVIDQLENAEVCSDNDLKRWYLSFIIVGGGFSGVELAGELNELVRKSRQFYQNFSEADVRVTLIHAGEQILPEVSSSLREFARKQMEAAGVRVMMKATAVQCTQEGIRLADGQSVDGATVVCTIGTKPLPLLERLQVPKERGRIQTQPDMSVPGHGNIWAIGDCAYVVNAVDGKMSPPTAQFAERQGKQVAKNVARRLQGIETKPFAHQSQGSLCSIGGHNAVAEIIGMKISGFPAWFVWRGVYLLKLPSIAQSIQVGIEWMLDLIFPRQLAHLRADPTKRIARAFFPAGDFIFREGEPASEFYMIEDGEVEVLEPGAADGHYQSLAILGAGDFFGEQALMDNRPRGRACRARTNVEAVVLGRNVFNEIFGALTPLKDALTAAVKRRTSIWERLPKIRGILDGLSLADHIEPITVEPLRPGNSLGDAIHRMNQNRTDVLFVVDGHHELVGVVTRTDLLKAVEVAAQKPGELGVWITAKDIMSHDPLALSPSDTTLFAVTTMREHGLVRIPVVESDASRVLKGLVRIDNIMESVAKQVAARYATAAQESGAV